MKIVRIVACFLIGLYARAETNCSLIVQVVDLEGFEVATRVKVTERGGRTLVKDNEQGGARFCDLGILPVEVEVGSPVCNQVTVRNVPLIWPKTVTTKVVYDRRPCLWDPPASPYKSCDILVRLQDRQGKPVNQAELMITMPFIRSFITDDFGRVLVSVRAPSTLKANVRKVGFTPRELSINCSENGEPVESAVMLDSK